MKLSLCMIVKNESRWIAKALQSVSGLVDEMIILDTGSIDDTVRIAKSFGAKVDYLFFSSQNDFDFSIARNKSIELATGDWILILDADEVIEKSDIEGIRFQIENAKTSLFSFIQTNYMRESTVFGWQKNFLTSPEARGYPGYIESRLVRLFKRIPEIKFVGSVHEHAIHTDGETEQPLPYRIHHYGKFAPEPALAKKHQFYLDLGKKKIESSPQDAHAWYELGVQYMLLNELEKAWDCLHKSESLDPGYVRPQIAMASLACRQENYTEAKKRFLNIIGLDPSNKLIYLHLPHILALEHQYSLAEQLIQVGERFVSDQPVFYINSGSVYQAMGNYNRASDFYWKALSLNPKEVLPFVNMGLIQMQLKQWDHAITFFEKALPDISYRHFAQKKIADCQFAQGKLDISLLTLLQASQEVPGDPEIECHRAIILIQKKELDAARSCILQISNLHTLSTLNLKHLEQCCKAIGLQDKVQEILKILSQRETSTHQEASL